MESSGTRMSILADEKTRKIFEAVVENRRVRLADLIPVVDIPRDDMMRRLEQLVQVKLVAQEGAPLPEWNVYFVTSDGLTASRQMRRQK